MVYRRIEFSSGRGWRGRLGMIVAAVLGIAIAITFIVFALSLAIIILPIAIVAGLIARWRWRKVVAEARKTAHPSAGPETGPVLDLDYEVVRRDRPEPGRPG